MATAARHYHDQLESVLPYFEGRGFTRQHCVMFGLGAVEEPLPGHELFKGRAVLPYVTPTGVVGLKFRCPEDHKCSELDHQKYLGLPGAHMLMFNTRAFLFDSEVIVLTEGELDAMAVQMLTGLPAVGYPGTQSWQHCWDRAFTGYQRVLIMADGDKPGRDSAKALAKRIPQADVIYLPDRQDSNSLLIQPDGLAHFMELCGLEEST